jgi:hypothetical protein
MSSEQATKPARYRDWQSRLASFIASREAAPFEWGCNDCALFVVDAVQSICGHDAAADVRGYSTALEAARVVDRLGGMRAIGASRFGEEIVPALAQVGDVGLAVLDGRETLMLCGGSRWLGPGPDGLVRLPAGAEISAAWRCI